MIWWHPGGVARLVAGAALALVGAVGTAGAQTTTQRTTGAPASGSSLEVSLVTFGLGQEVFERFGHNAIRVRDTLAGVDVAYDWGNFSFQQPGFLRRFLTGDTRYWMEGKDAPAMIEYYRSLGRPITLQRLALTPEQKQSLFDFLRWNALDENKYYRYDYYADNCSTRLRDALDRVLGGALRTATDSVPTALTYRRESVRLTDGDRPIQAGIDIALGRPADVPLTPWQSFFIPMRLRDAVRDIAVPSAAGGPPNPLVAEERRVEPLPGTDVVSELEQAPRLGSRLLLVGLVLAALVAGIRIMAVSRRGAAWGLTLVTMIWSLLCGLIGVALVLAWTATRHVFWAWNENLFQASPLSLVLLVLLPLALLKRRYERAARMVALAVLALALVGLVLSVLPGGQENRAIVALFLPVHLVLAWAVALPVIAPAPVRGADEAATG